MCNRTHLWIWFPTSCHWSGAAYTKDLSMITSKRTVSCDAPALANYSSPDLDVSLSSLSNSWAIGSENRTAVFGLAGAGVDQEGGKAVSPLASALQGQSLCRSCSSHHPGSPCSCLRPTALPALVRAPREPGGCPGTLVVMGPFFPRAPGWDASALRGPCPPARRGGDASPLRERWPGSAHYQLPER